MGFLIKLIIIIFILIIYHMSIKDIMLYFIL